MRIKDATSEKAIEIEEHNREIHHQRQLNSKLKVRSFYVWNKSDPKRYLMRFKV